jgi:DNA-binding winged helix-turn-helix (wHTH) protein
MVLDVPGGDMIEWVSALVDAPTRGMADADALNFARDRREIVVDGHAVELTNLEALVLAELIDRAPAVVRRDDLIARIWRRTYVGSNVVETVVRSLRKKLGSKRDCIRTVPKAGYRYVASGEENRAAE